MNNHFWHFPRKPLFLNYYFSSIKPGKISYQGHSGPSGGNAIDERADLSMLKSFSESLDRRSSVFWYNNKAYTEVYDLVTNSFVRIRKEQFALSNSLNAYRDTTGTAAHTSGSQAVSNALQELFQKNALALIWYSQRSYRRKFKGFDVLVNTDFYPLYNALIFLELDGRSCFGMGSSGVLEEACQKAFEEALLLLYENSHAEFLLQGKSRLSYQLTDKEQKGYFKSLVRNAAEGNFKEADIGEQGDVKELIPNWIHHVYVSLIPNHYNPLFKVTKLYSPDLFASLPYRDIVLAEKGKSILRFINEKNLAKVPDIPSL
ncbi:hypothetical protein DDV21_005325 [Streptococcus chenjunshii]|uniref:YcaO domain-containing protein n=1 Tax=Streptococcus chenjunshii TaxID=2173853 RepID=A0A372KPF0_9STRE|nr:YcaO-like family protein [Streptococcus chenjunshii]AXQ78543.1 hypothetical protein DDV21_005325 [Streptococcus chenjunshii]RFU51995.1 hypothetical protein DDV22_00720 [Streptococcus chenjunshii]RFU54187.1 hypothetical protein DDV23_01275 [Streptococcus chenjunshii]